MKDYIKLFTIAWLVTFLLLVTNGYLWANTPSIDLDIIAQIESSNDPSAYNKRTGASGMYQITKPCLSDYNMYVRRMIRIDKDFSLILKEYSMQDMFVSGCCKDVSSWYFNKRIPVFLRHFGIDDTAENRLIAYHAGIGNLKNGKIGNATKDYIAKYNRLLRVKEAIK